MPLATTRVDVFPTDKDAAEAAAAGLRDVIGDRPEAWLVSISARGDMPGVPWLVDVAGTWRGEPLRWELVFPDRSAEQVIEQFRLNLRPYPA